MLHTKFLGNWSTGSGEDILKGFHHIRPYGGLLGHVTSIMFINFHFHVPKILHTEFGEKRLSGL